MEEGSRQQKRETVEEGGDEVEMKSKVYRSAKSILCATEKDVGIEK